MRIGFMDPHQPRQDHCILFASLTSGKGPARAVRGCVCIYLVVLRAAATPRGSHRACFHGPGGNCPSPPRGEATRLAHHTAAGCASLDLLGSILIRAAASIASKACFLWYISNIMSSAIISITLTLSSVSHSCSDVPGEIAAPGSDDIVASEAEQEVGSQ